MVAKHVIVAAALVGLMMTGAMAGSALAQTNGTTQAAPAKNSMQKSMHKGTMHRQSARAKEGHKLDNIADKLNACEMKPEAERQSCISDATRG